MKVEMGEFGGLCLLAVVEIPFQVIEMMDVEAFIETAFSLPEDATIVPVFVEYPEERRLHWFDPAVSQYFLEALERCPGLLVRMPTYRGILRGEHD